MVSILPEIAGSKVEGSGIAEMGSTLPEKARAGARKSKAEEGIGCYQDLHHNRFLNVCRDSSTLDSSEAVFGHLVLSFQSHNSVESWAIGQ
jgi:hypothetical protein